MSADETRGKLLAAGRDLMLARGYAGSSVDDICGAAGVSKGSFYHAFGSKEEFGLAVLSAFHHEGVVRVRSGAYVHLTDPRERLRAFFEHLELMGPEFWRHGCLLATFAAELGATSPAIHARVAELFDGLAGLLAPLFVPLVGEEEAISLAEQTLIVLEGAVVMARAHDDPGRIAIGVHRFRSSLEGRMPGIAPAIT
jgi:TetR/AcrR family transcriptional repressor of nem operon